MAVAGHEAYYKDLAGSVRVNLNASDKLSLWLLVGYKSEVIIIVLIIPINHASLMENFLLVFIALMKEFIAIGGKWSI
ncbi:hypothetical protein [Bartonella sp. HY761]|uniref:hypothetical protein n=1 Tax=Bartonella sp. HY761 TaxID=2979330 RepID=UPI00220FA275|nr:hypothetical protein [Bartonella sp. HY761]UXN05655.1 porin [Bartonella sp. HY761]